MLTVAVYFLSQYPKVMQRLRQEVLSTVGPTRRPTYDDVREMKYLRAVINGAYISSKQRHYVHSANRVDETLSRCVSNN